MKFKLPRHLHFRALHEAIAAKRTIGVADIRRFDTEINEGSLHQFAQKSTRNDAGGRVRDPAAQADGRVLVDQADVTHGLQVWWC